MENEAIGAVEVLEPSGPAHAAQNAPSTSSSSSSAVVETEAGPRVAANEMYFICTEAMRPRESSEAPRPAKRLRAKTPAVAIAAEISDSEVNVPPASASCSSAAVETAAQRPARRLRACGHAASLSFANRISLDDSEADQISESDGQEQPYDMILPDFPVEVVDVQPAPCVVQATVPQDASNLVSPAVQRKALSTFKDYRSNLRKEDAGEMARLWSTLQVTQVNVSIAHANQKWIPTWILQIHQTHAVIVVGGYAGCIRCGAHSSGERKGRLTASCRGHRSETPGDIDRLLDGRLPKYARRWPDGSDSQARKAPTRIRWVHNPGSAGGGFNVASE